MNHQRLVHQKSIHEEIQSLPSSQTNLVAAKELIMRKLEGNKKI